MATPVKSLSSLFHNVRSLSPRSPKLLNLPKTSGDISPMRIQILYELRVQLSVIVLNMTVIAKYYCRFKSAKNSPLKAHAPITNSCIQINVIEAVDQTDESLLIDSPQKSKLLNYGFSKFDLLYLIGKGSFGLVIKGKYKGDVVAVKLVPLNSNQVNESNALHLKHKNIIQIFDIILSKTSALIIMEYCKNSMNLQQILQNCHYGLDKATVTAYSKDITSGLNYCHRNDVLHLDIKPQNVLLCNGVCKICDFGNCVIESKYSEEYKFHGTVIYAAPEILKGKKPSNKSDIYSLGILIWQLISNKNPYELLDSEVVIYKVVKFDFRPSLVGVDTALSDLCRSCWSANPKERPSSMELYSILETME